MSETMTLNRQKLIPIGRLISGLGPQFDKDKATKVNTLYSKLTRKEIPLPDFIRSLRSIAGVDTVKTAVYQMESRDIARQRAGQKRPQVSSPTQPSKRQKVSVAADNRQKRVADLIAALLPVLDSDRAKKVKASFLRFSNAEISRTDFIRSLSRIAGDDTIKWIVRQLKKKDPPVIVID